MMSLPRHKNIAAAVFLAVFVILMQGCVSRQEFAAYREQTGKTNAQIRQDLGKLNKQILADQAAIRSGQADIKADLIDLNTQIEQLRGQCSVGQHVKEEAARGMQAEESSMALQLSNLQGDMRAMQDRMDRLEQFLGLENKRTSSQPGRAVIRPIPVETPSVAADPQSDLTAQEAYEAAYRLHKAKQYEQARKAFERFVERYPGSPLRGNALFWTGETYYSTGDYEKAILLYQQVLKSDPKGGKAPDALLKMGYALEKIGEKQAAVEAFEKLVKGYPKSSQVGVARRKLQQMKPGSLN